MLPGFRFLFAAVVLTVSTLVFGLGAAALLRASHEQFASLPQLMPAPAPILPSAVGAAPPQEAAPPTLAMLRIENPVDGAVRSPAAEKAASATTPDSIPAPPPVVIEPPPAATLPVPDPHVLKEVAREPSPAVVVATPEPAPLQSAVTAPSDVAAAVPAAPAADPANRAPTAIEPETAKTAEPLVAAVPDAPATVVEAPAPAAPAPAPEPVIAAAAPAANEPAPAIAAPSNEPAITAAAPAQASAASEVPIQTAMLDQGGPAMETATPLAPVAIEGPIPLPRSRAWALARSQPTKPATKQRKLVSRTAHPQAARAPVAAPAPARPPSGFLFGE